MYKRQLYDIGQIMDTPIAEEALQDLSLIHIFALETQQMLLRAIQERRYRPVGDKADRNFNCLLYTS